MLVSGGLPAVWWSRNGFWSLLLACHYLHLFVNIITLIVAMLCKYCMTPGVVHLFECQITSLEGGSLDGVKYPFDSTPLVFSRLPHVVSILRQTLFRLCETHHS
jgi:hypothetical protein